MASLISFQARCLFQTLQDVGWRCGICCPSCGFWMMKGDGSYGRGLKRHLCKACRDVDKNEASMSGFWWIKPSWDIFNISGFLVLEAFLSYINSTKQYLLLVEVEENVV